MNFQKPFNTVIFLALLSTGKGQNVAPKDLIGFCTVGHAIKYHWNKTDTTNTFYMYKMERIKATVD